MGVNGPIPKRDDERVRRNTPDVPVTKVTAIGTVEVPDLGITNPHPLVRDLYESLKDSAQSRFYEPSDWQYARLTLHFVNKLVRAKQPSAMMLATANSMLTSLLMTEGDRRRVRLEVERNQNPEGAQVLEVADLFKQQLTKPNPPA